VTNLDESATLPLARLLMTRTNGNWFFMTQILEHLQNEHMMYYDLSTFQWKWDIDRVHGIALSENVANSLCFALRNILRECNGSYR
jgi:predicted ATPase